MSINKNDETPDIQPESETNEKFDPERRALLRGALGFVFVPIIDKLVGKKAQAEQPLSKEGPHYDAIRGGIRDHFASEELDENGKIPPEKLSEKEILLMDESMQTFFKHYIQPSFWRHLTLNGKDKEARETLETAMRHYGELWYSGENNGIITIKKRPKNSPNIKKGFLIVIQNGIITKINDFDIDYSVIRNLEEEWGEISEKIVNINGKILDDSDDAPPVAKKEWAWFEIYSMTLPRHYLKLLELKGDLTDEEADVRRTLWNLLVNREHPTSIKEMEEGKVCRLLVTRRMEIEGFQEATPENMLEMAYFGGEGGWDTFATFSVDGFLMVRGHDRNWARSDSRKTPFADMYRQRNQ